jgi:L-ascorbate metabolism protein UlaG (beta-lactamase superfamily)
MDPQTLKPLYLKGEGPLCIGPRYEAEKMVSIGIPIPRIVGMNAGECYCLTDDGNLLCKITAIPAAHEEITVDQWGNTKALGYLIELAGIAIYHSGDSLLYKGLEKTLRRLSPDLALLPVNGRKEHLSSKGIAGNFSSDEACILARKAGASFFIPHHFGLFDFNTVSEASIVSSLQTHGWETGTNALIPKIGEVYTFQSREGG